VQVEQAHPASIMPLGEKATVGSVAGECEVVLAGDLLPSGVDALDRRVEVADPLAGDGHRHGDDWIPRFRLPTASGCDPTTDTGPVVVTVTATPWRVSSAATGAGGR